MLGRQATASVAVLRKLQMLDSHWIEYENLREWAFAEKGGGKFLVQWSIVARDIETLLSY